MAKQNLIKDQAIVDLIAKFPQNNWDIMHEELQSDYNQYYTPLEYEHHVKVHPHYYGD